MGCVRWLLPWVLWGCGSPEGPPPPGAEPPRVERLSPAEHLARASLAVRGLRPSVAELEAVRTDPEALEGLVDQWLASDAFGATVEDLHAELYLLRDDTNYQLPVRGIVQEKGFDQGDLHFSTTAAPLKLVREIVLEDRPYTEILTAEYTLADEVVATVYGLPYDPAGPEWQRTTWVDGRPQAGLLSDSQIWRRHVSNAANFHRGRANFVSRAFLCEDIGARDVFVAGGVDIADEFAVAEAVSTQTGCVGCHNALDPLAAFFWGYKEQLQRGAILGAYDLGCEWDWSLGEPPRGSYRIEHWCYPLKFYDVSEQDAWADWHLQPPGYYGQPARDATDLGRLIAEDPRFATCTSRTFAGYLTQTGRQDLPADWVAELQGVLVDSGFSVKSLVKAIVLSEPFAAARPVSGEPFVAGLQTVRPEQLSRSIADLTGFVWLGDQDDPSCASGIDTCWGPVDLVTTDVFGYRSMMGGIDGWTVTHPTHTPIPTQQLALGKLADEAAGFVVGADFRLPAAQRRLLSGVEATDTDEARVREQLAALHLRILSEALEPGSAELDPTWELWAATLARSGDPQTAWKVVISALLQDPRMVLY